MLGDLFDSPWKILIIAAVVLILFGTKKMPDAARSLGRSMRILKTEIKDMHEDDPAGGAQAGQPQPVPPQQLTATTGTPVTGVPVAGAEGVPVAPPASVPVPPASVPVPEAPQDTRPA